MHLKKSIFSSCYGFSIFLKVFEFIHYNGLQFAYVLSIFDSNKQLIQNEETLKNFEKYEFYGKMF